MDFHDLLRRMVSERASDLFLKVGSAPSMRIDGRIRFLKADPTTPEDLDGILDIMKKARRFGEFDLDREIDTAYEYPGAGRFRVSISRQKGNLFFVLRLVQRTIPSFEDLTLPKDQLTKLASLQRGLVLVTGVTGSGKSTTLASIVNYMNDNFNRHIITAEDPIEFIFKDKRSIITQREVRIDTQDFLSAIKYCLRQSPDVIMIGEMRDRETMEAAIHAAETGHLVLSTLHTINAQQTVERIIQYFPPHQHELIRLQLSMILEGVISQRLAVRKDGNGRVPAVEIMMRSPTVRDLLREGHTPEIAKAIREGDYFGSQTFNQALKKLYEQDMIALDEAMSLADNPEELRMEIRGIVKGARGGDFEFSKDKLGT